LGRTAPVQAASLLLVGPLLDYWLTDKRVDVYAYNPLAVVSVSLDIFYPFAHAEIQLYSVFPGRGGARG